MNEKVTIEAKYFCKYRKELGFANQKAVKDFFGAKDIIPGVDFGYVKSLNDRLYDIIEKIDRTVANEIKSDNLKAFKKEHIDHCFGIMNKSGILPKLNNQGRRPEQVYFSWMRGFVVSNYFLKAVSLIFEVDVSKIDLIGDDDFKSVDSFKRTPKADLEIELAKKEKIRIEIQSGFTGINDIKQHKVLEAKRYFRETGNQTIAIHFDLYNGQAAFIKLEIEDNSINWITRQQMEGQTVFEIDQNYFVWKITEKPIKYDEINFN